MSKHTPGPWEIHEENTILGPKLDEKAVWLRPIVLQSKTGIKPENARLIAAAPDLLEALITLNDACRTPSQIGVLHGLELARAAIAKAKGEV